MIDAHANADESCNSHGNGEGTSPNLVINGKKYCETQELLQGLQSNADNLTKKLLHGWP